MQTNEPVSGSHQRERLNIIVFIATIASISATFFLVHMIKRGVEPQNCHMAGFTNCNETDEPVITAPHRREQLE
jgi:hypothetical protein